MEESLLKRSFPSNLIMLRVLGLYPFQSHKKLYKIYAFFFYGFLTVPVPLLAFIYLAITEDLDMAFIAENILMAIQVGGFIVKLLPFIVKADQIRACAYMIDQPLFRKYSEKQERFIDSCIYDCKRNSYAFLSVCLISLGIWGVKPLVVSDNIYPLQPYLPIDPKSGSLPYYLCYLYMFCGVGHGAMSNAALDPLVSGLATHATYQVKILKENLTNLAESADEEILLMKIGIEVSTSLKSSIIFRKISECVAHHNAILKFVRIYEKTFAIVVFTQFAVSVLVICYTCYMLSTAEPFTLTFIFMSFFLITMLMQIFFYCYNGTNLYQESDSIITAIYMGTWYEFDVKCRKALILLMEGAKKPMLVTAGKILDLSLVTFTTIIRRAYSLLAVLRNY